MRHEMEEAHRNLPHLLLAIGNQRRGAEEAGIDLREVDVLAVGDVVDPKDAVEALLLADPQLAEPLADPRLHVAHLLDLMVGQM